MMLKALLLALFPSFLQVPLRRLLGAKIGQGTKISFGSLVAADSIDINDNVVVAPFCLIRASVLKIGSNSRVQSLSIISTHTVELGEYTHIAPTVVILGSMRPKAKFSLGDHSRVFPFCWIEPGEGVEIGKDVGIGGHGFIFTHGSWPDYVRGGPIQFGPVKVEDNVWLPWRVTILPNVVLGRDSVIGANSLVNNSIPAGSLAVGSPAKVVKEGLSLDRPVEERKKRIRRLNLYSPGNKKRK